MTFDFIDFIKTDLKNISPLTYNSLSGIAGGNQCDATFAVCFNMLFRSKYCNKPSVISHIMDQVMVYGGASKKLFQKFSALHITNSYKTVIEKSKDMGKNVDEEVLKWKKIIEQKHEYKFINDRIVKSFESNQLQFPLLIERKQNNLEPIQIDTLNIGHQNEYQEECLQSINENIKSKDVRTIQELYGILDEVYNSLDDEISYQVISFIGLVAPISTYSSLFA